MTDCEPEKIWIGEKRNDFPPLTADGFTTISGRRAQALRSYMASNDIKDRVEIIGMGCTVSASIGTRASMTCDLDAAYEAYESSGVAPEDVDAYWPGTMGSFSGLTLSTRSKSLTARRAGWKISAPPGSESLRQASLCVASGAYDMAMAVGVEKLEGFGISPAWWLAPRPMKRPP